MLIMVLLILFISLLFITAALWSVVSLNRLQSNENIVIKKNIAINSCINFFNYSALYGDSKSNLRGPISLLTNGESSSGVVSFGYLNSLLKDRKYLILDVKVDSTDGKAPVTKKAFKPVPIFNYAHFVMNPDEEFGHSFIREECHGVVRANKQGNSFTNISGPALKDSGKPYIDMQDIDIDHYAHLAVRDGLYFDFAAGACDIDLFFYDNNKLVIYPYATVNYIDRNSVIAIKNGGYNINIFGVNSSTNTYDIINPNFNITFATDSPIVINSDIYSNNDFIFISTFHDSPSKTAFSMNIDKYIENKFIPNGTDIDTSSIYYDFSGVYAELENVVYLKSIFVATNGSFGFRENTYSGGVNYNHNIFNTYHIIGGLIEYDINYSMKKFENIPSSYMHLICKRNELYFNTLPAEEFPFIAPPLSKNIFCFTSKYF